MDNEPLPDFADGVREGARFIADECAELLEVRDIFDWVGCCFLSLDNGYREVGGERIGGWHCEIAVMGAIGKGHVIRLGHRHHRGRKESRVGTQAQGDNVTPINVFIPGDPRGQPRALSRAIPAGGGKWRAQVYEPDHTKTDHKDSANRSWAHANIWKAAIKARMVKVIRETAWKGTGLPLDFPLRVDLEVVAPRPLSHFGTGRNADILKPSAPYFWDTTPDRDNLDKIVLDTITGLGFWIGDERVCDGRIIKRYQRDRREETGVHIRMSNAVPGAHISDDPVQAPPELFDKSVAAITGAPK